MLAEVNAAVEGARSAGATEVVVNDSHAAMANLRPAGLKPPTSYISGRHKPAYMMQGLDGSFDAVFLVGYHGLIFRASGQARIHSMPPRAMPHTASTTACSHSGIPNRPPRTSQ